MFLNNNSWVDAFVMEDNGPLRGIGGVAPETVVLAELEQAKRGRVTRKS